jgi:hypothetical protein
MIIPCQNRRGRIRIQRPASIALLFGLLLFYSVLSTPSFGQIYNGQTRLVIPGTEAITPGPGVDLSGWNTVAHHLTFAL